MVQYKVVVVVGGSDRKAIRVEFIDPGEGLIGIIGLQKAGGELGIYFAWLISSIDYLQPVAFTRSRII